MAKRLGILLHLGAAVLLALTAYWLLFSTFMAYDDEGYVLVSLKNYSRFGGLYDRVFSQYGPFFYFFHDLGHRLLGYEFTNTTGRMITLLAWLTAAGASAHLVWRQTCSHLLTVFTFGLTFFHLRLMVSEPIHPGGLIAALVAIGAWAGGLLLQRGAMRGLGVTTGLIVGALALTKINVGVFFFLAAGAWFATQFRAAGPARWMSLFFAVLLVLVPAGLMRAQWEDQSGRMFMGLSVVASLTMLAIAWRERQPLVEWRFVGWSGLTLFCLTVVVVGSVALRGTELTEIFEGIVLNPLRHPGVYHFAPNWRLGAAWVGAGSLLLLALVVRDRLPARWTGLIIGIRLVLVLCYCGACLEQTVFTSHSFTMSYVVPFAWIFALPLASTDETGRSTAPAAWLGLILVLQYLHAYPVAGTQIAWGTFLVVPLMALGLHDAQRCLARANRPALSALVGISCLVLAIGAVGRLAFIAHSNYSQSRPLRLPGAEDLRLPEPFACTLRLLTLNATAHGDMLFSFPGMFSFNGWTELPTPTLANTTHWFTLLSPTQQEDIIAALDRQKRPVFIAQRHVLDFLRDNHFPVTSLLDDFLRRNFERAFTLDRYEFWVRRGRPIAWLGSAEILQPTTPGPGAAPGLLELIVAIPPGGRIASIEVATLAEQSRVLARWDENSGPLLSTALDLGGTAISTENRAAWGQPLPSVARLRLPLGTLQFFNRAGTVVYVRDAGGMLLAEARFMD